VSAGNKKEDRRVMLSQYPAEHRRAIEDWVVDRQRHLLKTIDETAYKAIQAMILVNGGSAVALAAFMGNTQAVRESSIAWVAQRCFLAGLFFALVTIAGRYHHFSYLFTGVKQSHVEMVEDKITLDELIARDNRRASKGWWIDAVAYLSFIAFCVGSVQAAYILPREVEAHKPTEKQPSVRAMAPSATVAVRPDTKGSPAPDVSKPDASKEVNPKK
jgi:hypothetical protein